MARKTLAKLDKELEKRYKNLEVSMIKKGDEFEELFIVPTDSAGINYLMGNGGVALGKIITLHGPESSGKTAVGFAILGAIQRNIKYSGKKDDDDDLITKGNVVLIDAERAYTRTWTEKLGVDTSEDCFRVVRPETGEMGLDIVEDLVKSGGVDAILIDSLNALVPEAVLENDMGDATMGSSARMISKSYSRLAGLIDKYKVLIISISQVRENMDKYSMSYAGGNATKFYSTLIIHSRRSDWLGSSDKPIGIETKLTAYKNKLAIPKRSCAIELIYKKGFSFISDYVASGIFLDLIERGGAWYTLPNGERFQGKEKVISYYKEHTEDYQHLVTVVNEAMLKKDFEDRGLITELEDSLIPEELKENEDQMKEL